MQYGLPLPGRLASYRQEKAKLLPSNMNKNVIYLSYYEAASVLETRTLSLRTFKKIWMEQCQNVVIMRPATDLCIKCQKYVKQITNSATLSEEEKSVLTSQYSEHTDHVKMQKDNYRTICKQSEESFSQLQHELRIKGQAPCSNDVTVHYSFHYAQQVFYHHYAQQVGPMFFKTSRKCQCFGVACEASGFQVFYVIDEEFSCVGKGTNSVTSLIHDHFNHSYGETNVELHNDNCAGQNKNSTAIGLNRSHIIYDGEFDVTLRNVTLISTSRLGTSDTVMPSDNQHVLDMYSFNRSADVGSIEENQKTLQSIDELSTNGVLIEMLKNAVCHSVKLRLPTDLGGSNITFHVFDEPVFVSTVASGLAMKNKTFMITHAIKTPTEESGLMLDNADNVLKPFPKLDEMKEPFEAVIRMNVFNEFFREPFEKLDVGINKVSVAEVLPFLKAIADMDTDGLYMMLLFPEVNEIYPQSVASMFVLDAEIYFKVKNGSLQIHFDITCEMSVTLRCDKNRTYSAFNFTMNLLFPAKVGYDNKFLTFKLLDFGGNFTVLNSTVGHIVDKETLVLLHNFPIHASGGLKKLNDKIRGIRLDDFLPEDVFTIVKTISIKEDSVIVGGSLSLSDPQLPIIERSDIVWVGNNKSVEKYFISGRDHTPRDQAPEEKKTCEKPQPRSVLGSATTVTYHVMLMCLTSLILYI